MRTYVEAEENDPMELLEVQDVALALRVGAATVRRYADEGRLPVYALTPRGQRLFKRTAIEVLKQEREQARKAS